MIQRHAQLEQNLRRVRDRIADAAQAVSRDPREIQLVAVTKYARDQIARDLVLAGCEELGESRPQELWKKAEALRDLPVRWHQIGHLQRNKVRRTLPLVSLVQSADSVRLLQSLESVAAETSTPADPKFVDVLLQVNVSGEQAKHGFAPQACPEALDIARDLSHVRIRGLMCMARYGSCHQYAARDFTSLSDLRDRLQETHGDLSLRELSMGMSADLEEGIKAGATIVRVGSALLEGLQD